MPLERGWGRGEGGKGGGKGGLKGGREGAIDVVQLPLAKLFIILSYSIITLSLW